MLNRTCLRKQIIVLLEACLFGLGMVVLPTSSVSAQCGWLDPTCRPDQWTQPPISWPSWPETSGSTVGCPGCANSNRLKIFNVNSSFGPLDFVGRIERIDLGQEYQYHIRTTIMLLPGFSQDQNLMLDKIELIATRKAADGSSWDLVSQQEQPISIFLSNAGDRKVLKNIVFRLNKDLANRSHHIGVSVGVNDRSWPITSELK